MTTVKQHIEHLTMHYKPDTAIAVHVWHVDDVLHTAEGMGVDISRAEAEQVSTGLLSRST